MDGPAKIGYFQISLQVEEEILWLDVTVDHFLRVAVPGGGREVGGVVVVGVVMMGGGGKEVESITIHIN